MSNTIVLKGNLNNYHEELPADAALSPGHVLQVNATNEVLKVTSSEGAGWNRMIAKEDALRGKTIVAGTTEGDYAAADIVGIHVCQPGDVVQAYLSPGVNYTRGTKLILSNTAGQLKALSALTTGVTVYQVVGEVEEALDLSATGAATALGKVRIY